MPFNLAGRVVHHGSPNCELRIVNCRWAIARVLANVATLFPPFIESAPCRPAG